MTFLYLIRHGRSTWNAEGRMQGQADPPLDSTGRAQAQKLCQRLTEIDFDAFYSSPLVRAQETARIIAEPHDLPVTFDDRLMERHFGEWTGLHASELQPLRAKHPNWWLDGPPGGESRLQTINRSLGIFNQILTLHQNQTVAIVSHGGLLGAYLIHVLGLPMDTKVFIHFGNTAVARIRLVEGQIHVISINDDLHLHDE